MANLKVTTDNLPKYRLPRPASANAPFGWSCVQAKEDGQWQPKWLIVDGDGRPIGLITADSFDDIDARAVGNAAMQFIGELHGLDDEDFVLEDAE